MHQGHIVEYAVKRSGYNISNLAKDLGVNRRSLYNYFVSRKVKTTIIHQIGQIIRHDFSTEFPELFTSQDFKRTTPFPVFSLHESGSNEELLYKEKYIDLLEKYQLLLIKCQSKDLPMAAGSISYDN